jgi:3-methyladenine DNA glycosylase AlkD
MTLAEQVKTFLVQFEEIGTRERAVKEKSYLKSDLRFCGVPVPSIRKTGKSFKRDHPDLTRGQLLSLVSALWGEGIHELRSLGVHLLELYQNLLTEEDFKLVEGLLLQSQTWAHVDWLAIKVAGPLVKRRPSLESRLRTWAKEDNFWIRRASLIAQLDELKAGRGNFRLFNQLASEMVTEKEFFIRKAIGWVLREVSKKQPDLAYSFLSAHIDKVSGLTLREGSRYLSEEQRQALYVQ